MNDVADQVKPGRWSELHGGPGSGPNGPGRLWPLLGIFFVAAFMPASAISAVHSDRPYPLKVAIVVGFVVYALGYLLLPRVLFPGTNRVRVLCGSGLLLVGLALVAMIGLDSSPLMIYAMALVAMVLPPRTGAIMVGVPMVGLAVAMLVTGRFAQDWDGLVTLASVTLCLASMGQLIRTVRALRQAQEEIATHAVTEERSRLARDLHDILGHSLTTITLKAGLARRVLESSDDRDRALGEITEVEDLARQALSDVRATVSGYREVSLSAELVGARAALRAAGVHADLPHAVDNVRPELQGVFGYVLREGVTNVLRHSRAARCEVRFGENWVEIRNDGECVAGIGHGDGSGNGLSGLRERLAAVGGQVEAGPLPHGGYRLRATATTVPATRPDPDCQPAPAPRPQVGWA